MIPRLSAAPYTPSPKIEKAQFGSASLHRAFFEFVAIKRKPLRAASFGGLLMRFWWTMTAAYGWAPAKMVYFVWMM